MRNSGDSETPVSPDSKNNSLSYEQGDAGSSPGKSLLRTEQAKFCLVL